MIFNRATGIDLNDWNNTAKPNAPVSVPFLWDTHWHNVVQWNGSAPNTLAFHRLGRNVGEVLGVFASADIRRRTLPTVSVRTSARRANLLKIEHLLGSLRSPRWPAELPAIDTTLAAQGQGLYDTYCVGCHAITPRDRPLQRMTVSMSPISEIGTDPMMAMNARDRMAKSGIFEGVRVPLLTGTPTPAEVPSVELTLRVAVGAILAPPSLRSLREQAEADEGGLLEDLKADQDDNERESRDGIRGRRDRLADLRQAAGQLAQRPSRRDAEAAVQGAAARRHLGHGPLPAQRLGARRSTTCSSPRTSARPGSSSATASSIRRTWASRTPGAKAPSNSTPPSRATVTPATAPTVRRAAARRTSSPRRSGWRSWNT